MSDIEKELAQIDAYVRAMKPQEQLEFFNRLNVLVQQLQKEVDIVETILKETAEQK